MIFESLRDYECEYEIQIEEPHTIRYKYTHKIVNSRFTRDGYLVVTLNGQMKYLHKIIATHFISNPNNYKYVRFIDGNKSNISSSNLKWVSRSEINKTSNRIKKKTNTELKQMIEPINLSRSQLRRWNELHKVKDYTEVKYSQCDNNEFDGFL